MGGYWSGDPDEVVPGLYIGNVRGARDKPVLDRAGVTHVVDVSAVPYEAHAGVRYLRLPIPDVPEFDIRTVIARTNAFIRDGILRGGRVLVHCKMGRSRSAAVVIAYLMAFGKMTFAQALQLLADARPIVEPNRGFADQLRAYQTELEHYRRRFLSFHHPTTAKKYIKST